jgi:formylglycine-generating enzyme required for sulfatase activity
MNKLTFLSVFAVLLTSMSFANNIQVSNIETIEDPNAFSVRFDLSWENSWRTSTFESNYDAAWIFMKIKYNGSEFFHVPLCPGATNSAPSGCEIVGTSDCMGVFVQRDGDGIGDISFEGIELQTEFGLLPQDEIEVCVYAIEMVYIPEGAFQVGGALNAVEVYYPSFQAGNSALPYVINSDGPINLGGNATTSLSSIGNEMTAVEDDFDTTPTVLPADFPTGFQSFYSMKYELSQGQYVAFLNSISKTDASQRRYSVPWNATTNNGFTISKEASPSFYNTDSPNRPCNFISWSDLAYYADWAGLRPMSELEFEKTCRGSRPSVPLEYAWGNSNIRTQPYEIENNKVSNPSRGQIGNYLGDPTLPPGPFQPFDCGWAAALFEYPTRAEAGATYYGVMEMSGNLAEMVVNVGTPGGRQFDGEIHGDGFFGATAVDTWPDYSDPAGSQFQDGVGLKGGYAEGFDSEVLLVSDRTLVNDIEYLDREHFVGGRLVRSKFDTP